MRSLLILLAIAHTGLSSCYWCDNSPDGGENKYDPSCGQDIYKGNMESVHNVYYTFSTCFTTVEYYTGGRVVRGGTTNPGPLDTGPCHDTGYSITCYCREEDPPCNNNLCQHCNATTDEPPTTTELPTTATSTATTPSTTPAEPLQCYSCIGCNIVNKDTNVETLEEFLSCFIAIELGTAHFVVRGGSPDHYDDGVCRHEADDAIVCYCSSSDKCNSDVAAAAAHDDAYGLLSNKITLF